MSRTRIKTKGRADSRKKRFALIPAEVIYCETWRHTSKPARALIADISVQYSGYNNGDLQATIKKMKLLGWTSPGTIKALLLELQHYGFLVQTKQGGLGIGPNLYALGWKPIDQCIDRKTGVSKLDDPSMFGTMRSLWATPQQHYQRPKRKPSRRGNAKKRQYAPRTSASTPRVAETQITATPRVA